MTLLFSQYPDVHALYTEKEGFYRDSVSGIVVRPLGFGIIYEHDGKAFLSPWINWPGLLEYVKRNYPEALL